MKINFKKIIVTSKNELDDLYNCSALTLPGLKENDIIKFLEWINEYTSTKNNLKVYIIKGKIMNNFYNLTGRNIYPEDLTIISIKLSDIENPMKLAIPRFQVGAKWFDDLIENNKI